MSARIILVTILLFFASSLVRSLTALDCRPRLFLWRVVATIDFAVLRSAIKGGLTRGTLFYYAYTALLL